MLGETTDKRVRVFMVSIAAQKVQSILVVTCDSVSEMIVAPTRQVIDVHVENALGLLELLLLRRPSRRVRLNVPVLHVRSVVLILLW